MHIDHVLGLGFAVDQIGDRRFGLSESAKIEGRMIEERHGAVQRDATCRRASREGGREARREGEKERGMCGWRSQRTSRRIRYSSTCGRPAKGTRTGVQRVAVGGVGERTAAAAGEGCVVSKLVRPRTAAG